MTSKTMFQSDCCRANTFTVRNGNDTYHLECDKCKKPCVGFAPTVDKLNLLQLKRCKCSALTPDECQCGAWEGSVNHKISEKNRRLIAFLDKWFSEPDDKGEKWWDEFIEDMKKNRFYIGEKKQMNEQRIHILNGEDRDIVSAILLNNGYKVWYETIGEIEILCYETIDEKGE